MKKFIVAVADRHHLRSCIHKVFIDVEAEDAFQAQEKAIKEAMEKHGPKYHHINRCVEKKETPELSSAPDLLMKKFEV